MATHANIISFQDVKNASRSLRMSSGSFPAESLADRPAARGALSDAPSRRPEDSNTRSNSKATPSATSRSGRNERKRTRAKARASKMFDAQFSAVAAGDDAENAPRAALYEGQMGASQRRAARMQRASEAGPATAKLNPAGWFSSIRVSARAMKAATALLCVVLTGAFLYVPAQQYYQSLREHDRLEAEYAVLNERNGALDAQNDALASNAGMEDAVRQKYGYVVKGDQTAVVTGLSDEATDTSRGSSSIEANVLSSSVKAPEEWYTPYLDAFFGVS